MKNVFDLDFELKKIVLTGGPCAGKTTALSWIVNNFERSGWKVLTVNEAATELIKAGMGPCDFMSVLGFQEALMRMQIFKENMTEKNAAKLAKAVDPGKILIVCDRGICDNHAYLSDGDYAKVLRRVRLTQQKAFERYDAVFHLVTAADGAEEFYTLSNNEARSEDVEQARRLDHLTQNAWIGHPHLRVIRNEKGKTFEQKLQKLMAEIAVVLGEPEPLEIERKFLVKCVDFEWISHRSDCQKVDILQTYLLSNKNEEVRVRQRGVLWDYTFTKTVKRNTGDPAKRVEIESRITHDEYLKLLMDADPKLRPIHKTRYCFLQRINGQYFEIDVYPGRGNYAILEVEVPSKDAEIIFPDFLEVVREVTDDPRYRNREIAKHGGRLPKEV